MMRSDFYGRWLFVADLVLVSVWAVFAMRYSLDASWCVAAICALRIAICFRLRRRSVLATYSAIAFACAYFFIPYNSGFEEATCTMGYYLWYIFGNHEEVVHFYNGYHSSYPTSWIFALQIFWIAWNTLLPTVVAFLQLATFKKYIRRKLLWLCVALIVVEIAQYNLFFGCYSPLWSADAESVTIILLAALPFLRPLLNRQRSNHIFIKLLSNRELNLYLSFAGLFLAAMIIGLREVYTLRMVGLLVAPPLFYVLLCRAYDIRPIRLVNCLVLCVAGAIFEFAMENSHSVTVLMLVFAVSMIAWTAMAMILHNRASWKAAVILCIITPAILVPMLMGLDPYVVTSSTHTRPYMWNLDARNGLYVTEYNGLFGLRDRYDEILPMKYTHFENLDPAGNYISVSQPSEYGLNQDVISVYDLAERRFIINEPVSFVITEMKPVNGTHFNLINDYGRHFATLRLPGTFEDEYVSEPKIEPHFSDASMPVEKFLEIADSEAGEPESGAWADMYQSNPRAYALLEKIYSMAEIESSPDNDLNFARAVHRLIDANPTYRGDSLRAFNELNALLDRLQCGNTTDMTVYASFQRLFASLRLSDAYSSLIAEQPYYRDEYVAWHNLIEAIACYADYKSHSDEWYQCKMMDEELERAEWLENRRTLLESEKDALAGRGPSEVTDRQLMTASDVDIIFSNYHSAKMPEYYHPMWNEIKPAFEEWIKVRDEIAGTLSSEEEAQYRLTTDIAIDEIYHLLAPLDVVWLVPALYR